MQNYLARRLDTVVLADYLLYKNIDKLITETTRIIDRILFKDRMVLARSHINQVPSDIPILKPIRMALAAAGAKPIMWSWMTDKDADTIAIDANELYKDADTVKKAKVWKSIVAHYQYLVSQETWYSAGVITHITKVMSKGSRFSLRTKSVQNQGRFIRKFTSYSQTFILR